MRPNWILVLMVAGLVVGYLLGYQITYEMQIRSYDVFFGDTLIIPGELYVSDEGLEDYVNSVATSGGMRWALILGGVGFLFGFLIPLSNKTQNTISSVKGWGTKCPNCRAINILNSNDLPNRITCGNCDDSFIPESVQKIDHLHR